MNGIFRSRDNLWFWDFKKFPDDENFGFSITRLIKNHLISDFLLIFFYKSII